jgi:hypothetical protein
MQPAQLAEGLWRWSVPHPKWRPDAPAGSSGDWPREVGCTMVESDRAAVFIDALAPPAETFWEWADTRCAGRSVHALSTLSFHRRDRDVLVARYGAATSRARAKLPREVAPLPLRGAGETVFFLPDHKALVVGDRLISTPADGLRLCPQSWLDYLPSRLTVGALRELLRPVLALPIERVLVSHGEPVLRGGHDALAAALAQPRVSSA